ncbi:MAG: GNAT family N-acetyltransferase [Defluviitaleaceae bacterium]|nr:GNAT family N-acetyltransferase [Defluviitaleaceae bacterium]
MIRLMEHRDIPRVAEIRVMGWRSAYRGIVSDDFLFNEMLVATRIPRLMQMLNDDTEIYIYDDGIIKAFSHASQYEDDLNFYELGAIYVDPFMQGQGIGTAMLAHFEKTAAERSYNNVCLWTFEKNSAARAFYEKHGYKHNGDKKTMQPHGWKCVYYTKKI